MHMQNARKLLIKTKYSELDDVITVTVRSDDDLPVSPRQLAEALQDYVNNLFMMLDDGNDAA